MPEKKRKTYGSGPFLRTFQSGLKCWYRSSEACFSADSWEGLAEEMTRRGITVERAKRGTRLREDAKKALKDRFGEDADDDISGGEREAEDPGPGHGESKGTPNGKSPAEAEAPSSSSLLNARPRGPRPRPRPSDSPPMQATPKAKASPRPGCPSPTLATNARPASPAEPNARASHGAPLSDSVHLTTGAVTVTDSDSNEDPFQDPDCPRCQGNEMVRHTCARCRVPAEPAVAEEPPSMDGFPPEEVEVVPVVDPSRFETYEEEEEEELFADVNNPPKAKRRRCLEAVFRELMALEVPPTVEMAAALDKARVAVEAGRVASFAKF